MAKPIHISELERAERRKIDWARVHIEADRRKPFAFTHNVGRWINPISRKTRSEG